MNVEVLEELPPLAPLDFFALEAELPYAESSVAFHRKRGRFLLPDLTEWQGEEHFADVSLAWNEAGLFADLLVHKPFEEASYPRFADGDAVELFFDTRDLKTAGFATRFCHQFVFLPSAVQGILAQEISHFRTEDTHPHCDAAELQVTAEMGKKSYALRIFIPAHCLHGFEPASFGRIGFTYRIHRFNGAPQHFGLNPEYFSLEQHPRLWMSFTLIK
jgi:hypothetical protein